jgi:hypothetical protein
MVLRGIPPQDEGHGLQPPSRTNSENFKMKSKFTSTQEVIKVNELLYDHPYNKGQY